MGTAEEELVDEAADMAELERRRTCTPLPFKARATISGIGSASKSTERTLCDVVEGGGELQVVRRKESPRVKYRSWSVACPRGTSHPSSVKVTVITEAEIILMKQYSLSYAMGTRFSRRPE